MDGPTRVTEPPLGIAELLPDSPHSPTAERAVIATPIEPTGEGVPLGAGAAATEPKRIVPANAESEANPFDDQTWRAEGGSDSEADLAGAHPIVGGNPLRETLAAFLASKRNIAIVAGAGLLLVVVIAMAIGGGDKPATTQAAKQPSATKVEAAEPRATDIASGSAAAVVAGADGANGVAGADGASATPGTGDASEASATPGTDGTDGASVAPGTDGVDGSSVAPGTGGVDTTAKVVKPIVRKPAVKKAPTLGGKQVVLENDTQAREGKPVPNAPKDEQAAIARARRSYTAGNSRLFAGDADSAIQHYRQALAAYPAYVAGYRGLGLAYAQKGDRPNAIKALRTYVGVAPQAKDASLIRKRIDALSK